MKFAANGDLNMVQAVVQKYGGDSNFDINEKGGWNSSTALMIAAQNKHIDIVDYLISQQADINITNDIGKLYHIRIEVSYWNNTFHQSALVS
jgi:ankyrin repeat protein